MTVIRVPRSRTAVGLLAATAVLALSTSAPAGAVPQPAQGGAETGYIVTLKGEPGALTSAVAKAQSRTLASRYGARADHTYTEVLHGFSTHMTKAEAALLAADPSVTAVTPDRKVTTSAAKPKPPSRGPDRKVKASATQPSPPSWGLDRIDQPDLPLDNSFSYPDTAGSGVTTYIIDTGVRISHQDFGGRASYGYDAIDKDMTAADGHGHGTHVAGTVAGSSYGVAKQADIVGVRVLDDSGSGTTSQVIAGIDWVTKNASKPAVANMSLGGIADSALDEAVRNSVASGITYAIAAGNSSAPVSAYSPARVGEAITVGATQKNDAMAVYSNYGSGVDILAPGSSITSAWNTGDSASNTISGTSMATPHVAGAAAVYLAGHRTAGPAQVSDALTSAAARNKISGNLFSPNLLLQVTG